MTATRQRTFDELIPRHSLPENLMEAALVCGVPPHRLVPTSTPGIWRWRDGDTMRSFRYVDSVDPDGRGFRRGGKYRTWRSSREAWLRQLAASGGGRSPR